MISVHESPSVDVHHISPRHYAIEDLDAIVSGEQPLRLSPETSDAIERGAAYVAHVAADPRHIYGINTGFGSLCGVRIAPDRLSELQHNQLRSHACGVGPLLSPRLSRLVMLVKLLTFRSGHTGISRDTVERLLDFWNAGVIPAIPSKGSVGASGDLAPLAHMALPLLGEGRVWYRDEVVTADVALREHGWSPLRLRPKEGLALTNGVQFINALAADCLVRARRLIRIADIAAALSIQAFSAARSFYQPLLHRTSRHRERMDVAANLSTLLEGSNHWTLPHADPAQEDPYSFRCVPQVHGAIRATFGFARRTIEEECNSVSDNPLVFADEGEVLTGGSLHGESTAFASDFMAIAASELASVSERRTYQLLSGQHGLPPFLVRDFGINSGLMIPQYTAAALVNQNKVLATPASIDTIPTCHLQEDHVSMGGTSVLKLGEILDNCEYVLGIELMTAAQGVDLCEGLRLSPALQRVHDAFREQVPPLSGDRQMNLDIEAARRFLLESATLRAVETALA